MGFSVRQFENLTEDYPCTTQAALAVPVRARESQVIDPYKAIWLVLDVIKIIEHNHNNVYQPHNCFIVLQPQHAGLQAARLSGTVLTPHQSHDLHHHHHPPMSIIILEWKPPYYIPWLLLREERLKSEEYLYINTL